MDTDRNEEKLQQERHFAKSPSWISYLPGIYNGEDSFLFRFLSLFQELYEEMTQEIDGMPGKLYPAHADRRTLEWLAKWFAIDNTELWDDRQLAWILENRGRLSKMRGSRAYLQEMVKLFTGETPVIVEYYQTCPYRKDIKKSELLGSLYGNNPFTVTVLLSGEAASKQQRKELLHRIVEDSVPAGIECKLIFLQPCIYLDRYSYIGMNSLLAGYNGTRLDESELLPYRSVMGKNA